MIQETKKIKILFSIGRLSVGGAEKLLLAKLNYINTDIFEPHLLTLFQEQKQATLAELVPAHVVWHKQYFSWIFDIVEFFKLISFLKKKHFDVIVTELFSANLLVRVAAIIVRTPVIISYEHNLYPNKSRWQILVDWFLSLFTNVIIVDADIVKSFTSKQEHISERKFFILYHPPLIFEKSSFTREQFLQKYNILSNATIILTVSRLVEEKGHAYLINAAQEVVKNYPNAYFFIVGWGPLENNLRSKIKDLKLEKNVILTGRMDIKDILPHADIYVEPAIIVDISIALLEAMRARKAVVATDVGEISVFVQNKMNGFLVPPRDAATLSARINELLNNADLCKQFGEEAFETMKPYTITGYMEIFQKLIYNCLNNAGYKIDENKN